MSITSVFRLSLNLLYNIEQLPPVTSTVEISSCDGKARLGSVISINYQKMDLHCDCLIKPLFMGTLQFASDTFKFICRMEVNIYDNKRADELVNLPCGNGRTSVYFNVTDDDVFQLIFKPVSLTNGTFNQHISVFKEATLNGNISVSCRVQNLSTNVTVFDDELTTISTSIQSTNTRCISSCRDCTSNPLVVILWTVLAVISLLLILQNITLFCRLRKRKTDHKISADMYTELDTSSQSRARGESDQRYDSLQH